MGTYTTNYGLYKPAIGEAGSVWASIVNANFDIIESFSVQAQFKEQASAPANIADWGQLYTESDNRLYFMDGDGVAHIIGGTGLQTFKSYMVKTSATGTYWIGGFYGAPATDANLTQASATITYGGANGGAGAHAFIVAGGAGSVDTGTVKIQVQGTSISNAGVRTASDTEDLVADITAMSANEYFQTTKKWIGTVTWALVAAGGATTYSADFNYGRAKYEDFGGIDFTFQSVDIKGRAGASDSGFNIQIMNHHPSGWTYSAAAFVPGNGDICSWAADYVTEKNLINGENFAYKRTSLAESVLGGSHQGIIIKITTAAINAIDYMEIHLGADY